MPSLGRISARAFTADDPRPARGGFAPLAAIDTAAERSPRFDLANYDYLAAVELAVELAIPEPLAITLARRGLTSADEVRAMIEGEPISEPAEHAGVEQAAAEIERSIDAGERVTVYGDFDADGVCATAVLVSALRACGADCDWYIPDRAAEGYGLSGDGVRRVADRGTSLLITVDCGIASPDEVAEAQAAGMRVVVTDHHEPGEVLPDCTIVHPRVAGGPSPDLCGAAVAWKLAGELRRRRGVGDGGHDLDLVALATVADVVSLTGENRTIVRRGLDLVRTGPRPGIRALAEVAGIELGQANERDLGYRLAPRVNAVGRLYRADAGVELMLTSDEARAGAIAAELQRANSERRGVEREVLSACNEALAALDPGPAQTPGLVVAGEGWHNGVLGIVASRLVERYLRPVIVIGLDERGRGRGSGRSIPGFDLLQGLRACDSLLERYGGHSAAAGLEIAAGNVEAFREAFAAHAAQAMSELGGAGAEHADAIVGSEALGLELAEQLEALRPFGHGNPEPRLLLPAAELADPRTLGEEGRHTRLSLRTGSHRAQAVRFRDEGRLVALAGGRADVLLELELNRWNGSVEPRARIETAQGLDRDEPELTWPDEAEWLERFEARVGAEAPLARTHPPSPGPAELRRTALDRTGRSVVALISELCSSGAGVLVLCCDAVVRRELAALASPPRLYGGPDPVLCSQRLSRRAAEHVGEIAGEPGALAICDWAALDSLGGSVCRFDHVVSVDPPPGRELAERALAAERPDGVMARAWGSREVELSLAALEARLELRGACARLYSAARSAPQARLSAPALLEHLQSGPAIGPAAPEMAADAVRCLVEVGLCRREPGPRGGSLGLLSSDRTDLSLSPTYRAAQAELEEQRAFLSSSQEKTA